MRIQLHIEGMSCGHCVARVRKLLEAQSGAQVLGVEVGGATLDFQGDEPTAALAALAQAGFPARVAARP